MKKCKVQNCKREQIAKGYCNRHYRQLRKHGKLVPDAERDTRPDLIGKQFGRWIVIRKTGEKNPSGEIVWECLCDCGSMRKIGTGSLIAGRSKSCGCIQRGSINSIDIAGQRFAKLVVIERMGVNKKRSALWKCLCDCGNETVVSGSALREGSIKSCGCLKRESIIECNRRRMKEMVGKKFNRLTAMEPTEKRTACGGIIWLCKCDCGNETMVNAASLRNGMIKSCGCLAREKARINIRIACKSRTLPEGQAAQNVLLLKYKKGAQKRNLEWVLTDDEFFNLTQRDCFYCGVLPSQISKPRVGNGVYIYNGIDRIDSTGGYTRGNCVSCCGTCNKAKMTMSLKEFVSWIKRTSEHITPMLAPSV